MHQPKDAIYITAYLCLKKWSLFYLFCSVLKWLVLCICGSGQNKKTHNTSLAEFKTGFTKRVFIARLLYGIA